MDIYIEGLKKNFNGISIVNGVSLEIREGEKVAVIGPNGAGKTTLFRLLNLTLMADDGILEIGGIRVNGGGSREIKGLRTRIATIYQQHNLIPRLRVIHNVLSGRLGVWSTPKALYSLMIKPLEEDKVYDLLESIGLKDKAFQRTDRLSGGEQQRVAIARALIQNPDLILADEPCSSLDPANGEKIIRLLVELSTRLKKTLITNLHCVDSALAYFRRIVGIKDGMVVFDLPPEKVNQIMLDNLYGDEREKEDEAEGVRLPFCCSLSVKEG